MLKECWRRDLMTMILVSKAPSQWVQVRSWHASQDKAIHTNNDDRRIWRVECSICLGSQLHRR